MKHSKIHKRIFGAAKTYIFSEIKKYSVKSDEVKKKKISQLKSAIKKDIDLGFRNN